MKKEPKDNMQYNDMFSGIIGQEYDILKQICPLATEMSRLVGEEIKQHSLNDKSKISIVELGGGTGITSLSILLAHENAQLLSIDNAVTMQNQAKFSLNKWVEEGRLSFSADDALTSLQAIADNSVEIVASAYTLHNFEVSYRFDVLKEIYRVLKKEGVFINGDRYALDDLPLHTKTIQQEVAGYFKVLTKINRLDLLEHWIIHLFNDESEGHIMRESNALQQLREVGFSAIELLHRQEVNALMIAKRI